MEFCKSSDYVAHLVEEIQQGGNVYIMTKYVKGGDLLHHIHNTLKVDHLSEDASRALFRQMVQGVADIHDQGLVHRDIKYLNILVSLRKEDSDKPAKIKITDFGLCRRMESDTVSDALCGTVGFASPEVLQEQPCDFKTDIWSLGVILFSLLSARVPFVGSDERETINATINKPLTFD